jgi:hypothetical protein
VVNQSAHFAIAHYMKCAVRRGIEFTDRQLAELSCLVVSNILAFRNADRLLSRYPQLLPITSSDELRNERAIGACWTHCRYRFPSDYALRFAALAEMSIDQVKKYDQEHSGP